MNTKFELDEDFEWFLDKFGAPTNTKKINDDIFNKYKDKLPSRLLDYWREYGFCGFMDGLFWIVNPDDYEDALETWLGDTEIVEQDAYYVIGRSAFGELYVWGEKTGYKYDITPLRAWVIEKEGDEEQILNNQTNSALEFFFGATSPEDVDSEDGNSEPLFEQCKIMHDSLAYDEMYAFEPALFLGGESTLENTTKVNIFAHLSMLASFGQKELLDKDGLIQKAFG